MLQNFSLFKLCLKLVNNTQKHLYLYLKYEHIIMDFLKFLTEFKQVQTTIGLLSFVIASILGYFYTVRSREKKSLEILIPKIKTETQANLLRDLDGLIPRNILSVINQRDSRDLLELEIRLRAEKFKLIVNSVKFGIGFFFLLMLTLIGHSYFEYYNKSDQKNKNIPVVDQNGNGNITIIGNSNNVNKKETK